MGQSSEGMYKGAKDKNMKGMTWEEGKEEQRDTQSYTRTPFTNALVPLSRADTAKIAVAIANPPNRFLRDHSHSFTTINNSPILTSSQPTLSTSRT
jgi:hypothetical protein